MTHIDRHKVIPSVYLILERDGKFLFARRQNTGYEDGNYGLVAGHAEAGETLTNALRREVREEAGIDLPPDSIELVLTMHRQCGDHERMDFFFRADGFDGEMKNSEPDKCDDMSWFACSELPENVIPYIRHAIECYDSGTRFTEFDW